MDPSPRFLIVDHQAGSWETRHLPHLLGDRWQEDDRNSIGRTECPWLGSREVTKVTLGLITNSNWRPYWERCGLLFMSEVSIRKMGAACPRVGPHHTPFECPLQPASRSRVGSVIQGGPDSLLCLSSSLHRIHFEVLRHFWVKADSWREKSLQAPLIPGASCTWTCFDSGTKYTANVAWELGSPPHPSWLWVLIPNWNLSSHFTFGQTRFFSFLFFLLFLQKDTELKGLLGICRFLGNHTAAFPVIELDAVWWKLHLCLSGLWDEWGWGESLGAFWVWGLGRFENPNFQMFGFQWGQVYLFLGEMPDMRLKEPFENVSIREATAQVITNETLGTCRS